jgi:signal transduction histidine kinase
MPATDAGVLERLPCGWLRMDASATLLHVNGSLCRMLGTEPQRLVGKAFDSLLTRPSQVLFQSYLLPLIRLHGRIEEFALVFDLGAGKSLEAVLYSTSTRAEPPSEAGGAAIEMVVASIRKRRGIEDELLHIKRAADQAPGMMFQLIQAADGACRFPYVSEGIRRLYGITEQQAHQAPERLLGLLDPATRAELAASLAEAGRTGRHWRASFEISMAGQPPRWHEAHATPRRLAAGVILWHGHCADVTDRRALERARIEARSMAELHAARNEFLARVSHELRTPLNGILGFAQLLASHEADNLSALQRERLTVLTASSRHLLTLVN